MSRSVDWCNNDCTELIWPVSLSCHRITQSLIPYETDAFLCFGTACKVSDGLVSLCSPERNFMSLLYHVICCLKSPELSVMPRVNHWWFCNVKAFLERTCRGDFLSSDCWSERNQPGSCYQVHLSGCMNSGPSFRIWKSRPRNAQVSRTCRLSSGSSSAVSKGSSWVEAHEKMTPLRTWFITSVKCFLTSLWSLSLAPSLLHCRMIFTE